MNTSLRSFDDEITVKPNLSTATFSLSDLDRRSLVLAMSKSHKVAKESSDPLPERTYFILYADMDRGLARLTALNIASGLWDTLSEIEDSTTTFVGGAVPVFETMMVNVAFCP